MLWFRAGSRPVLCGGVRRRARSPSQLSVPRPQTPGAVWGELAADPPGRPVPAASSEYDVQEYGFVLSICTRTCEWKSFRPAELAEVSLFPFLICSTLSKNGSALSRWSKAGARHLSPPWGTRHVAALAEGADSLVAQPAGPFLAWITRGALTREGVFKHLCWHLNAFRS